MAVGSRAANDARLFQGPNALAATSFWSYVALSDARPPPRRRVGTAPGPSERGIAAAAAALTLHHGFQTHHPIVMELVFRLCSHLCARGIWHHAALLVRHQVGALRAACQRDPAACLPLAADYAHRAAAFLAALSWLDDALDAARLARAAAEAVHGRSHRASQRAAEVEGALLGMVQAA